MKTFYQVKKLLEPTTGEQLIALIDIICRWERRDKKLKFKELLQNKFYSLELASYWTKFEIRDNYVSTTITKEQLKEMKQDLLKQYDELIGD